MVSRNRTVGMIHSFVQALSWHGLNTGYSEFNSYYCVYPINTIVKLISMTIIGVTTLDTENFLEIVEDGFMPTPERAIVDSIRYDFARQEGILLESIQSYVINNNGNLDKLFEVSDFYGIPREEMDYWIKEAEEWELA